MDPQKFGSFIKMCRAELGMKQADLAMKLCVTDKAVSRWERGIGFPDIKLLEPLANALNISIVELIQSKRLPDDVPQEDMDVLMRETQEQIEEQKHLSWRRRIVLVIGHGAMIIAALTLFYASRNAEWDPIWLGPVVYGITFVALFFGSKALRYIVRQMYKEKRPWGIWSSGHMIIVFVMALAGVRLIASAWTMGIKLYPFAIMGGLALITGALLYFANHEDDING